MVARAEAARAAAARAAVRAAAATVLPQEGMAVMGAVSRVGVRAVVMAAALPRTTSASSR
jgi:hypothetical protein